MLPNDKTAGTQYAKETFPFHSFCGTHEEIGRQYGESCKALIDEHLHLVKDRLYTKVGATRERIEEIVLQFRSYVCDYAPFYDEEITGLSAGANISLAEAYTLQLRAEINKQLETGDECTTFAVRADRTANNVALIGQDADLPALYAKIGVVTEMVFEDAPAVLQFTPAGQLSYIGINDRGMGCFGNFLTCDGWRTGFPRYLLSRLALTHTRVSDAIDHLATVKRASSRNLIMMDATGAIADMETTADRHAVLHSEDGCFCHSNHYISPELAAYERHSGEGLRNSQARLQRMRELLLANDTKLNVGVMQTILRDREGKYPLCRMLGDEASDTITAASVIAQPGIGKLHVAIGPPNLYVYKEYAFTRASER